MLEFDVASWSAWSPGLPDRADWIRWAGRDESDYDDLTGQTEAEPEPDRVPSRVARRLSTVTKMGLKAAFTCCDAGSAGPEDVRVVWVTRHGEIDVTLSLLEDLAEKNLLSPTAFGNSVPNTPSAYFSILTDNTRADRTVCAGPESFGHGFLDALGMLHETPEPPVLLVQADGRLPGPLDSFNPPRSVPFAVAFLLSRNDDPRYRLEVTSPNGDDDSTPHAALEFLRWMLRDDTDILTLTHRQQWTWRRS